MKIIKEYIENYQSRYWKIWKNILNNNIKEYIDEIEIILTNLLKNINEFKMKSTNFE